PRRAQPQRQAAAVDVRLHAAPADLQHVLHRREHGALPGPAAEAPRAGVDGRAVARSEDSILRGGGLVGRLAELSLLLPRAVLFPRLFVQPVRHAVADVSQWLEPDGP